MNSTPDDCPFCATTDHLSYQWPGSMTADMPDRPCRVICTHIDHDTVVGPTAYGKLAATVAWNTRPATNAGDALREARDEFHTAIVQAYSQGAHDVHDEWQKHWESGDGYGPPDPDFTEAAHDHAASKMPGLVAALSASPEGEGK